LKTTDLTHYNIQSAFSLKNQTTIFWDLYETSHVPSSPHRLHPRGSNAWGSLYYFLRLACNPQTPHCHGNHWGNRADHLQMAPSL